MLGGDRGLYGDFNCYDLVQHYAKTGRSTISQLFIYIAIN